MAYGSLVLRQEQKENEETKSIMEEQEHMVLDD